MSDVELQAADIAPRHLARLLTDSALRRRLLVDRDAVMEEMSCTPGEASALMEVDVAQLDAQADCLIRKRMHEVAKLLPNSWKRLGCDREGVFWEFVDASPWPTGHLRHVRDAYAFGQWLIEKKIDVDFGEWQTIRFQLSDRRFAVYSCRTGRARVTVLILMRRRDGRCGRIEIPLGF